MKVKETLPIDIKVKTSFSELQSNLDHDEFFFVYHITVTNNSSEIVQLLSRKWFISDSNGESRHVEGEGVVGEKPVIEPGRTYEYYSGCLLKTGFGKMKGFYTFKVLESNETFDSEIPEFHLVIPWVNN